VNTAGPAQEALDAREGLDTIVIAGHEAMSWIMGGMSAAARLGHGAGHAGLRPVRREAVCRARAAGSLTASSRRP
jgi:hypothetical protein